VQPRRGVGPYLGHQAGQDAHARERHTFAAQPRDGLVEQCARSFRPRPRPGGTKSRSRASAATEVGEAIDLADLGGVLPLRRRTLGVRLHHGRVGDVELAAQVLHHPHWRGASIRTTRRHAGAPPFKQELRSGVDPRQLPAPLVEAACPPAAVREAAPDW